MAYERIHEQGFTFLFKVEPGHEDLLHIFARHLTTADDALDVWFDESTSDRDTWNDEYDRWESQNRIHTIYWRQLPDGNVLMITCFRNGRRPNEADL